ncbi:MAG: glycosyltransferase [Cetobacterium sp.]
MNKKIFSLVVATVNREQEIEEFFKSLKVGDFPLDKIEVILVDQNKEINLVNLVQKYRAFFQIIHIKSNEKGLSRNRNIGLKKANGSIIAFPDDDCKYFKNTLVEVLKTFQAIPESDAVIGKIIDENGKDCIRKWGRKLERLNSNNFYSKMSSITLFKKNKDKIKFDEDLGAGSKYGSSEDADLLYKMIKNGDNIFYNPEIILFHPKATNNFDEKKAYSYGVGHGVFCRKNLDLQILKIYIMGLILVLMRILKNVLIYDKKNLKVWLYNLNGRVKGFRKNYEQ